MTESLGLPPDGISCLLGSGENVSKLSQPDDDVGAVLRPFKDSRRGERKSFSTEQAAGFWRILGWKVTIKFKVSLQIRRHSGELANRLTAEWRSTGLF